MTPVAAAGRPVRPQNKSCPAGGTFEGASAPDQSLNLSTPRGGRLKRGVIVAPPSGNTIAPIEDPQMRVIHKGFDTINLSIEANIPKEFFEFLTKEQELAADERSSRLIQYESLDFELLQYGGSGYRFILKSGQLGVTWMFKKPNPKDSWGIYISIGSTLLATQGLGYARALINSTLDRLGVRFQSNQVSLNRADFCVDILAPDFELFPDNFVIHSHTNRADHLSAADDVECNGKSGQFTSVTIGKMPGRQVIVYDKRREVIDKQKPIWWEIWNANLRRLDLPLLDRKDRRSSQVWRVEARAGKRMLKDRWQIRTWEDFDRLFGDFANEALQKIRYCEPTEDTNRARWPNHKIWDLVRETMDEDLEELCSFVEPSRVKQIDKMQHIKVMTDLIFGNALTLFALEGVKPDDLQENLRGVGKRLNEKLLADEDRAHSKLAAAKDRYRFVAEGGETRNDLSA